MEYDQPLPERNTPMRSTKLVSCAVATVVTAGLSLPATAAWAAGSQPALDAIKAAAHTAVTNRVTRLNSAIGVVTQNTHLGADQATLATRMQDDITGLNQLDATVQADTTAATAKADAQKVFTDFRIFALVLPVTHMVVATDTVNDAVVPRLNDITTKLQDLITKKNATDQQATLDDMKTQIAAAQAATAGLSADLLTFTPAQWNANHTLLQADRDKLRTARTDLVKARQDAKSIVAALRNQ
jgi:hypothetical protein